MTYAEKAIVKLLRQKLLTSGSLIANRIILGLLEDIEAGKHLQTEVAPARSNRETIKI